MAFFAVVLLVIAASPIENKQLATWVFGGPIVIWLSFDKNFRKFQGYGENQTRLGEFINNNPILKLWLIFYCLLIIPILAYTLYTSETVSFVLYATSFALLLGPILVVSEFKRFKAAAKNA